jgi:hypothetical protein
MSLLAVEHFQQRPLIGVPDATNFVTAALKTTKCFLVNQKLHRQCEKMPEGSVQLLECSCHLPSRRGVSLKSRTPCFFCHEAWAKRRQNNAMQKVGVCGVGQLYSSAFRQVSVGFT